MASGHLERMRKRPVPPVGRTGRQMSVDSAMRQVDVSRLAAVKGSMARRANDWLRGNVQQGEPKEEIV